MRWLDLNKLRLNALKTKYMLFHMPQKIILHLSFAKQDNVIDYVNSFNFLRITFDCHLTWKSHLRDLSIKGESSVFKKNNIMTLFRSHGRDACPISLWDLGRNLVPHVTFGFAGPWYPVGWWQSSHDRVSREPACEISPRAKLESDRY